MAGFFDGEGSILIQEAKRSYGNTYILQINLGNTNRELLEIFRRFFHQGRIVCEYRHPHKDLYAWRVYSRQALRFLEEIHPFLRSEHRRLCAELGIEFQRQKRLGHKREDLPNYRIIQKEFCNRMRELNGTFGRRYWYDRRQD